ncbi:MAG: hypothetical protein AAFR89_05315 [Cyanobacteria bacterium J06633_1]
MYLQPRPQPQPKKARLTPFETWWANVLPAPVKAIMPHWAISAGVLTGMALFCGNNNLAVTLASLFWASMLFTLAFRGLRPVIGKQKWLIACYHAMLFAFVASPVFAQNTITSAGDACANIGLFGPVAVFVENMLGGIKFAGADGGALSVLVCQVIGFLTIALVLGFLGALGYVSYQVGYQRQPISTTLDPLFGFLIFAGGSALIIALMTGDGGGGAVVN